MSHAVAHVHRHHVTPPAGVLDPDIVDRWETEGRLGSGDIIRILAAADPADPHPLATYIARIDAVTTRGTWRT